MCSQADHVKTAGTGNDSRFEMKCTCYKVTPVTYPIVIDIKRYLCYSEAFSNYHLQNLVVGVKLVKTLFDRCGFAE